mgnify:CR=1 FL=1
MASDDDDSDKSEPKVSDEESDGDFFQAKNKTKENPSEQDASEEENKALPKLSKKAMRKIKAEGPYAGKNKIRFDSSGNVIKKTEFDSDYMTALRKGEAKNSDGTKMQVELDQDV